MSLILSLRRLVDFAQFNELKIGAQTYLSETADPLVKPLLALAYAHLGERQECKELCLEIEENITELDADARIDLAAVYCLMQRIDDAQALLEAERDKGYVTGLLLARLAWCKMVKGESEEAVSLYEESAQLESSRLTVWRTLIGLYLSQSELNKAQQALNITIDKFEEQYDELPEQSVKFFTEHFRRLQLEIWVKSENLVQAEEWLDERREDIEEEEWCTLVSGYSILLAGLDQHSVAEEALRSALRHYPYNLNLISQLAELAQIQGRTMQTVQILRRAIKFANDQDKPDIPFLVRLSSACLHNMPEQARKTAEDAVEKVDEMLVSEETPEAMINQFRLQAKNALAQVESQEQNFEKAEDLFNQILELNPYFIPALQGLGQQQMQRGDIDAAVALFERVKEIDPARGYSSLINARHFPDDDKTLERMEKAARQPGMEGSVKSGLLLQIASAYEKRKEYDKAFELAIEGNDAYKKQLNYDPSEHRNQCARVRHVFSRPLYDHRKECGIDSSLPVFVLGMPRSGTTLVEQIIAGHSKIFGAGELGVIPSKIQGLNRWERHVGSGRSYPDCIDDMSPYVSKKLANSIIEELKELAAEDKPEAEFIVDKLPHNFENIGLIKFFFPNAKIISVRRDPRDIAISNYFTDFQAKHGGMGFAYDLTWIGEQLADHNLMMHHWNQVFPNQILEMKYEDVVEDLEGSARKMLEYIGVEWEEEVLSFNKLDRPVKTASVWQVRQPIYKTSTAKWMRYKSYLAPLLKGTNAKIEPAPITDRIVLPIPGFLQTGVDQFRENKLDDAELNFKKMLHHNPEHAAANYMVGLVYCQKGHVSQAIPLFEKATDICPWQKEWRDNLVRAYEETNEYEKAEALKSKYTSAKTDDEDEVVWNAQNFIDQDV